MNTKINTLCDITNNCLLKNELHLQNNLIWIDGPNMKKILNEGNLQINYNINDVCFNRKNSNVKEISFKITTKTNVYLGEIKYIDQNKRNKNDEMTIKIGKKRKKPDYDDDAMIRQIKMIEHIFTEFNFSKKYLQICTLNLEELTTTFNDNITEKIKLSNHCTANNEYFQKIFHIIIKNE